jgi:hypothetical protein
VRAEDTGTPGVAAKHKFHRVSRSPIGHTEPAHGLRRYGPRLDGPPMDNMWLDDFVIRGQAAGHHLKILCEERCGS